MPISVTRRRLGRPRPPHEVAGARFPRHVRGPRRPGDASIRWARRGRTRSCSTCGPCRACRVKSAQAEAPVPQHRRRHRRARARADRDARSDAHGRQRVGGRTARRSTSSTRRINRVARAVAKPMMGRTIAVLGAKGGVGSTTVAVNLATALRAASGEPTLLMDLHLAHGDASVFFGVEPRFSVLDAIENIASARRDVFQGPGHADQGGSRSARLVEPRHPGLGGRDARSQPDRVRDDDLSLRGPRLSHAPTRRWWRPSTRRRRIVVVANQELATLRGASRIANNLRHAVWPGPREAGRSAASIRSRTSAGRRRAGARRRR